MSVLVVDEDAALARVWAAGLAERGFVAAPVSRVAAAMAMVRCRPPQLLIGSLIVDGESLLPLIVAAQYRRADMATILLSDAASVAHADLFGRLGSLRCVLGKPVVADDLIDIAEHVLLSSGARVKPLPRPAACAHCAIGAVCARSRAAAELEAACH